MKCKLITTTSNLKNCYHLKRSLDYFGWDYHFIEHAWKGFGDKILETYKYLKANPDITHFFYSDAWDTMAFGTMEEALKQIPDKDVILFSAERACYPHPDKAEKYPHNISPWHFLNGGGWFASSELFCKMVDKYPLDSATVDQVYFTDRFLDQDCEIELDYDCKVFQTIAFCPETDFIFVDKYMNQIINKPFNTYTETFPIFFHGNGHTPMTNFHPLIPPTLQSTIEIWEDRKEVHKYINESFTTAVNNEPKLKQYRDWIESNIFGFGERSFLWMWKLLVKPKWNFLEIGVFRGQILGLVQILGVPAKNITGITPLDSTGDHWESDYAADIKKLHETFNLKQPNIIKGLSTDPEVIEQASKQTYDCVYIDGGHAYEVARHDIFIYSSFVKVGGYLVIDDSANKFKLPEGYFRGIEPVSRAVDELLPNEYYKELFNVMHNRVFQRIK